MQAQLAQLMAQRQKEQQQRGGAGGGSGAGAAASATASAGSSGRRGSRSNYQDYGGTNSYEDFDLGQVQRGGKRKSNTGGRQVQRGGRQPAKKRQWWCLFLCKA